MSDKPTGLRGLYRNIFPFFSLSYFVTMECSKFSGPIYFGVIMTKIVSFTVACQINAKKWIQLHGSLKKSDPNSVRSNIGTGRKRKLEATSGAGIMSASSSVHQGNCTWTMKLLCLYQ
jgi:hypothetical protein